MGCVGLLWHAHEATAETAMLAGLAAAYYGVAISHRKPFKSGICFGLGTAVAFLAKGLAALLQPLAAALLVLPLCASFRQRNFAVVGRARLRDPGPARARVAVGWPRTRRRISTAGSRGSSRR